jgi:hypothetical protein
MNQLPKPKISLGMFLGGLVAIVAVAGAMAPPKPPHVYQCSDAKPQIIALYRDDRSHLDWMSDIETDVRFGRRADDHRAWELHDYALGLIRKNEAEAARIRKEYDDHGCPASDKP